MDNFELNLKNIQDQIDSLNNMLSDAQNQKLTTEVHLQNEQQELDNLTQNLQQLTGLNNINEVENYLSGKQIELNSIMNDLQSVSNCINSQYTFTENDVKTLKGIIDKYNIPIVQE